MSDPTEPPPLTDDQRLSILITALTGATDQLRTAGRIRATNLQNTYLEALTEGVSPTGPEHARWLAAVETAGMAHNLHADTQRLQRQFDASQQAQEPFTTAPQGVSA